MITQIGPFEVNREQITRGAKGKFGTWCVVRYENEKTMELYFCETKEEAEKQFRECFVRGNDVLMKERRCNKGAWVNTYNA